MQSPAISLCPVKTHMSHESHPAMQSAAISLCPLISRRAPAMWVARCLMRSLQGRFGHLALSPSKATPDFSLFSRPIYTKWAPNSERNKHMALVFGGLAGRGVGKPSSVNKRDRYNIKARTWHTQRLSPSPTGKWCGWPSLPLPRPSFWGILPDSGRGRRAEIGDAFLKARPGTLRPVTSRGKGLRF